MKTPAGSIGRNLSDAVFRRIEGRTLLHAFGGPAYNPIIPARDLHKKHHWQITGPTFYQLHLLFDKHAGELTELVDEIAERIQILGGGGGTIAMAAETTKIERPRATAKKCPCRSAGCVRHSASSDVLYRWCNDLALARVKYREHCKLIVIAKSGQIPPAEIPVIAQ